MEIRVLRYFLAVAREENISQAAEVLHITQPTLSRQISQLEEELGVQLFTRGKHLSLTDAGVMLRRRAEEVTDLMDRIESEFAEPEEVGGRIAIGEGALSSSALLMETMMRFREKYPKVQYAIYMNTADYIREQLDKGLCDFGLLLEPVDIEKYDFLRMPGKEVWGLFMSKDHPLAEREAIRKEDLAGIPLITPSRLSVQKEISGWLGEDVDRLNVFGTCNIVTNAQIMVETGDICFMAVKGAMDSIQTDRLVFRPLYPELTLTSVLVWKKFQPVSAAAGKFLDEIKQVCRNSGAESGRR